jgi:hypothetical protein
MNAPYFNIPQENRSIYYANSLCDALEKPKNLVLQGIATDYPILNLIASVALAILLAIPAAIGYGVSKAIYALSGEKIKDYQAQLDAWQEKVYNPYGNGPVLEAVIDGLIRHRIKPSDCPFDTIQTLGINSKGTCVHCIFAFEGPLHDIHRLSPNRKKFLILMAPAATLDLKHMCSLAEAKNSVPTDEETRAYYKKSNEKNDRENADKCSFLWVPPSSTASFRHLRTLDSSTMNTLKGLFEKNGKAVSL